MIERYKLLEQIEEIQDRANTNNIGSNEAELDTREFVADLFEAEFKKLTIPVVVKQRELLKWFLKEERYGDFTDKRLDEIIGEYQKTLL